MTIRRCFAAPPTWNRRSQCADAGDRSKWPIAQSRLTTGMVGDLLLQREMAFDQRKDICVITRLCATLRGLSRPLRGLQLRGQAISAPSWPGLGNGQFPEGAEEE